ncbi:MAG: cytochrome c family protein [Candidatus Pelagibacterales bacterium]|nr:MAG: cytochrome c family protein [Pelagibacterales bacterium]
MNKIIVSIVFAIVLVIGINVITDTIYYVEKPKKSAYQIDSVTAVANTTAETSSVDVNTGNIMALFASTNAVEGAKVFKKCAACHSISQGGGNKIGPALWGVLGRKAGSISDYKYSKAMVAYAKPWSFEEMDGFLIKPKDWIKGTKMSYAGIKNAKDRAAVILYMNENTDNPLPLQ